MREIADTTAEICEDSTKFAWRYSRRRHASQHQITDVMAGTVSKSLRMKRTRRKCQKRKTPYVCKPTSHCGLSIGAAPEKASSSSIKDSSVKIGLVSRNWWLRVKIKLCIRVFLPLTFFVVLLGMVSLLWIQPRHARRPYSSLADDDYPNAEGTSSHISN